MSSICLTSNGGFRLVASSVSWGHKQVQIYGLMGFSEDLQQHVNALLPVKIPQLKKVNPNQQTLSQIRKQYSGSIHLWDSDSCVISPASPPPACGLEPDLYGNMTMQGSLLCFSKDLISQMAPPFEKHHSFTRK